MPPSEPPSEQPDTLDDAVASRTQRKREALDLQKMGERLVNLDAGDLVNDTITYTATDGSTQQITVSISGTEDAPTLDNAIVDAGATEGQALNLAIPADAFSDPDAGDALTYTARQSNGDPLVIGNHRQAHHGAHGKSPVAGFASFEF